MELTIQLDQTSEKRLQHLVGFMVDYGLDEVTDQGVIEIAFNEFYREFEKLDKFQDFLYKKESINLETIIKPLVTEEVYKALMEYVTGENKKEHAAATVCSW